MTQSSAFYAGAASGFIVRLITQPLDVLKIRFQLQVEPINKQSKPSYYKNILQASKRIFAEEGILGFWKGHVPAQCLSIVFGAVQFQTYEYLYSKSGSPRHWTNDLLFGGIAGSTSTLFCQPIDVIRTRLVSQGTHKTYRGMNNAILQIAKNEGLYGFFRGLVPSLILIFPQTAIQFLLYNQIKKYLSTLSETKPSSFVIFVGNEPCNQLISGSIAGVFGKISVYPLDLAKRRLQVQGFEEARLHFGRFHKSYRFMHSIHKTVIEEGFFSLFKGLLPSSIKSGVVSSLTFYFYEQFRKIL